MSNTILTMAWEVVLPPMEKLVLASLADFANEAGLAWPSVPTLSRRTGANERTIYRAIKSLRDAGHMSVVASATAQTSARYRVHPCHVVTPDTESPLTDCRGPLTQSHPTPDTQSVDPCHSVTLTIIEPPLNLQEPKAGAQKATKAKDQSKILMSDDWQPAPLPDDLAQLVALWPADRQLRELREFREYWIERRERRPGWDRTWKKRISDVHDRVMRDSRGGWKVGGPQPATEDATDAFVRRMERKEGQQRAGVEQ